MAVLASLLVDFLLSDNFLFSGVAREQVQVIVSFNLGFLAQVQSSVEVWFVMPFKLMLIVNVSFAMEDEAIHKVVIAVVKIKTDLFMSMFPRLLKI